MTRYPEFTDRLRFPGTLAFAQLGSFHRTHDFLELIRDETSNATQEFRVLPSEGEGLADWCQRAKSGSLGVIDALEVTNLGQATEQILAELRPKALDAVKRGASLLIVSACPTSAYPALAGSSILADAIQLRPQPLLPEQADAWAKWRGVTDQAARQNIVKYANGSRRLVDEFSLVENEDGLSGREKLKRVESRELQVATQVFAELGPEIAAWLDHFMIECGQFNLSDDEIPHSVFVPLKASGILQMDADNNASLAPFANQSTWVTALAHYIESVTTAPEDWGRLVEEFFHFERVVRRGLRERLQSRLGSNWRALALADHEGSILELARRDSIPNANSLDVLRAPLDWLSLGALLELAVAEARAGRSLMGNSAEEWKRLADAVVPIRNRVAHMRLARPDDFGIVRSELRRWQVRREKAER